MRGANWCDLCHGGCKTTSLFGFFLRALVMVKLSGVAD
jgi:hypothetical protein